MAELVAVSVRLFTDGFALMRERLPVYLGLAALCAFAGSHDRVDLQHLDRLTALRVVLVLSLVAIFFVLPPAVRRIEPSFRMTLWRTVIAAVTIGLVGVLVDLGYLAAFAPGVVGGVLLPQALLAALLSADGPPSARRLFAPVAAGVRESFTLTRDHFATTLGVVALSLAILGVPFFVGLLALVVAGVLEPRSLVVSSPLLFLVFVYFECVRYGLLVRWYGKLRAVP